MPELLVLQGARIGLIGETEETDYLNKSVVKALTGGDIRTARNLYSSEMVQLHPTYTIFLATNHEPRVPGGGGAMWDRLLPIPFNTVFKDNPIEKHEKKAKNNIWEWANSPHFGITIVLLKGWLEYAEKGLGGIPECVGEYHKIYKEEEDPFKEFRDECLIKDILLGVKNRSLVVAYRNWCNDNQIILNSKIGDRAIKRGIVESLKEWGCYEKRTNSDRVTFGLRFNPMFDDYATPRPIKRIN